jgi:hypothetical protein
MPKAWAGGIKSAAQKAGRLQTGKDFFRNLFNRPTDGMAPQLVGDGTLALRGPGFESREIPNLNLLRRAGSEQAGAGSSLTLGVVTRPHFDSLVEGLGPARLARYRMKPDDLKHFAEIVTPALEGDQKSIAVLQGLYDLPEAKAARFGKASTKVNSAIASLRNQQWEEAASSLGEARTELLDALGAFYESNPVARPAAKNAKTLSNLYMQVLFKLEEYKIRLSNFLFGTSPERAWKKYQLEGKEITQRVKEDLPEWMFAEFDQAIGTMRKGILQDITFCKTRNIDGFTKPEEIKEWIEGFDIKISCWEETLRLDLAHAKGALHNLNNAYFVRQDMDEANACLRALGEGLKEAMDNDYLQTIKKVIKDSENW